MWRQATACWLSGWHATGERSGIDVSSDWFGLWTFRDGRIARLRFFYDRAEALEAAGLPE